MIKDGKQFTAKRSPAQMHDLGGIGQGRQSGLLQSLCQTAFKVWERFDDGLIGVPHLGRRNENGATVGDGLIQPGLDAWQVCGNGFHTTGHGFDEHQGQALVKRWEHEYVTAIHVLRQRFLVQLAQEGDFAGGLIRHFLQFLKLILAATSTGKIDMCLFWIF